VVSLDHEFLVELFRKQPSLAGELLRICAGIDVGPGTCELSTTDLGQVVPTEYRADAVVVLRDNEHVATSAIVVEVQRGIDAAKRWSWPIYIVALRAALECPVTLLVLALDGSVARWARQPIEIGHPHFCLRPIAIAAEDMPESARSSPELAVLCALAHPESVDEHLLGFILALPDDKSQLYWDTVMAALPALVRATLEAEMLENREYKTEFARKYFGKNLEDARGREGLREAIRVIGEAKLGDWAWADEKRIETLDQPALRAVIRDLATAATADEARAVLAALA
jgi:hypothetical protein